ncbi:MAG: glucosidase [Pirellulaceae bacterium]|nr:glucosidase [Pirellulaceae bacterium]
MGICDREGRLNFSFALWNGRDPILKERLFGVPGPEGNHGEDVKECYYYLDATPTTSYARGLYKYPHARFPYEELADVNKRRSRKEREYELTDTGLLDEGHYFDCVVEYAKAGPDDLLMKLTVFNRGPIPQAIHVLPTLWFRNSWIWGCEHEGCTVKPRMRLNADGTVLTDHESLKKFVFRCNFGNNAVGTGSNKPIWLFTENETNPNRHTGQPSSGNFYKDAFHRYVVNGEYKAVDARNMGTKAAAYYMAIVQPDQPLEIHCRLSAEGLVSNEQAFGDGFEQVFVDRQREADEFYASVIPSSLCDEEKSVSRKAYAGLIWTKQFYHYIIDAWIKGDPNGPPAPEARRTGRNSDWHHLFNRDVISMPDKWEYPWYAAWDLAFHMIPMSKVDPEFAKSQLILFLREWYMHPNGQIPAYEWALGDVNPPVHAWACWEVYLASGPPGKRDREFLSRTFQKLLLNFTWWVNRKDTRGDHVFSGGFLGLDNIGVFDRSKPLPGGGTLDQADATAWMAFFCGNMLQMALELAEEDQAYADMASKFFEHYVAIAEAMNSLHGTGLWDEADGFYYDHLLREGKSIPMRVRSMVGLIPLCTGVILYEEIINRLPGFQRRMNWFLKNRGEMSLQMTYLERLCPKTQAFGLRLLAIPSMDRFKRLLSYLVDENEFLSPFGIRSMSAVHRDKPFVFPHAHGVESVGYEPGESDSYMFGGNSNWRGPIWFPLNYLIIQALRKYHEYYGDSFTAECPTGSGVQMNLKQIADEIERRLVSLFKTDETGKVPCHGNVPHYQNDSHWKDLPLFYEFFHGDSGAGLGASHQTGWTALVASMLEHSASHRKTHS